MSQWWVMRRNLVLMKTYCWRTLFVSESDKGEAHPLCCGVEYSFHCQQSHFSCICILYYSLTKMEVTIWYFICVTEKKKKKKTFRCFSSHTSLSIHSTQRQVVVAQGRNRHGYFLIIFLQISSALNSPSLCLWRGCNGPFWPIITKPNKSLLQIYKENVDKKFTWLF